MIGCCLLREGAGGGSHPHPALSLNGEGKNSGPGGGRRTGVCGGRRWLRGRPSPQPSPMGRGRRRRVGEGGRGDDGRGSSALSGGPLTEFGRRRPSLPLPLERVKSGGPGGRCSLLGWLRRRPLTDFGRGRPNLPLPLERVKSGATCIPLHPNVRAGVAISTGRPSPRPFPMGRGGKTGSPRGRCGDGGGGIQRLGQRTPYQMRAGTPESFGELRTGSGSPLGEGKERRNDIGECKEGWGGGRG